MSTSTALSPESAPGGASAAGVDAFVRRAEGISTADLVRAIPPDCFERHLGRSLLALAVSLVVALAVFAALAVSPWWLLPPLWFVAGTTAWGLYVIGHDCGHGSFSRSRRLNYFVGHLMLTPFLYPFHSWRLLHNRHHANTNSLENDIDWRPLPKAVYRRLPAAQRLVYRLVRTVFWWAGTLHQWATRAFDLSQYATEKERRQVRFSILLVVLFAATFFPLLVWLAGPWGLVKYWLVPWLIAHGWFSLTTLTHHTHPEVPYMDKHRWSPVSANLTATMFCRYPRWMEFLAHDINVHIPHHVAPGIPHYHLRRAHESLRQAWPHLVREFRFSWRHLHMLLTTCQLHDDRTGHYLPFTAAHRRPAE